MAEVKEIDDPRDVFSQLTPVYDVQRAATPDRVRQPGYYGLPILKRPFWKWEIALYFFSEGISAGSYILCTMADVVGKGTYRPNIRVGHYLSLATLLPCPPLLIADLGRPERFHHMLRIWKRTSPMNHGAWALSGYGAFLGLLTAVDAADLDLPVVGGLLRLARRLVPRRIVGLLGMPFALTMVSYPGVLLSTTSNPVWAQTHFLGALFACSSMSTGAAALALANHSSEIEGLHEALHRFEDIATAAEAVALGLYLGTVRKAARPLVRGKQSKLFLFGAIAIGIVAPALLRRSRSKAINAGVAPLLTLAGGLALKWSITHAGQESALDAELANRNAPTKSGEPFWGPKRQGAGGDSR